MDTPSLDGLSVFAEYRVRHPGHHYTDESNVNLTGAIDLVLVSVYFVLIGFLSMYSAKYKEFSTFQTKHEWGLRRLLSI